MESKLPAVVVTKPSRFGTRNLEIASPLCVVFVCFCVCGDLWRGVWLSV